MDPCVALACQALKENTWGGSSGGKRHKRTNCSVVKAFTSTIGIMNHWWPVHNMNCW